MPRTSKKKLFFEIIFVGIIFSIVVGALAKRYAPAANFIDWVRSLFS
jgi:hypothetical protein